MLGGVAPILIFSFSPQITQSAFGGIAGIPVVGDVLPNLGIPIPLYLDENLTGIYVESESKAIDIDTNVQPRYDGKPPSIDQRGLQNLVTVNLIATQQSVVLTVILGLIDMIFQRVVQASYKVSYINGATTVFGGLLHGFQTQQGSNDNLIHITLQIQKGKENVPNPPNVTSVLPKITGATPVAVSG
jgi:hypothetical protein